MELNPSAARFGIKRGLKIYQTNLENFKTNIKYDIITLFDVLEHLSNPKQIIKYAKKILKKTVFCMFMYLIGTLHHEY